MKQVFKKADFSNTGVYSPTKVYGEVKSKTTIISQYGDQIVFSLPVVEGHLRFKVITDEISAIQYFKVAVGDDYNKVKEYIIPVGLSSKMTFSNNTEYDFEIETQYKYVVFYWSANQQGKTITWQEISIS